MNYLYLDNRTPEFCEAFSEDEANDCQLRVMASRRARAMRLQDAFGIEDHEAADAWFLYQDLRAELRGGAKSAAHREGSKEACEKEGKCGTKTRASRTDVQITPSME